MSIDQQDKDDGPEFDFKRFLVEMFGSSQGLLSFLRAYRAPLPGAAAVDKWFYREKVPSFWFAILLVYLQLDRGALPSLEDYLIVEGDVHV